VPASALTRLSRQASQITVSHCAGFGADAPQPASVTDYLFCGLGRPPSGPVRPIIISGGLLPQRRLNPGRVRYGHALPSAPLAQPLGGRVASALFCRARGGSGPRTSVLPPPRASSHPPTLLLLQQPPRIIRSLRGHTGRAVRARITGPTRRGRLRRANSGRAPAKKRRLLSSHGTVGVFRRRAALEHARPAVAAPGVLARRARKASPGVPPPLGVGLGQTKYLFCGLGRPAPPCHRRRGCVARPTSTSRSCQPARPANGPQTVSPAP